MPAMLDKARQRLARLPGQAQRRVRILEADGEHADEAVEASASPPCYATACSGYEQAKKVFQRTAA